MITILFRRFNKLGDGVDLDPESSYKTILTNILENDRIKNNFKTTKYSSRLSVSLPIILINGASVTRKVIQKVAKFQQKIAKPLFWLLYCYF